MQYICYGMTKTSMVNNDIEFSEKGWHRYKLDAVKESVQQDLMELGDAFVYTDTDSIKVRI